MNLSGAFEEIKMEKEYSKGYQRKPEHPADIDPLCKAGLKSFTPESITPVSSP